MQNILAQKRIWIAWERQRRTLELSQFFNCKLFLIIEKGLLRYPVSIIKTFIIIKKEKPDVLFVQNPSMVLAVFSTTLFRLFFKYHIVVDRHSNFLLTPIKRSFFFEAFFHFLSFVSIKFADLTIVSNEQLASVIEVLGGRAKVLPDKIPSIYQVSSYQLLGCKNILIISSFATDEPIREIAEAASQFIEKDVTFYFTGSYTKYQHIEYLEKRKNIVLTGFLPEQDFIDLLFSVDVVMVLTTIEYTLLCGCYEAVAAEKPLITSNSLTLKSVFKDALFVNNTSAEIVNAIRFALCNISNLQANISKLRTEMEIEWEKYVNQVGKSLKSISTAKKV